MSRNINRVVQAIQKLYPKALADSSWDNTGLLVDTVSDVSAPVRVLLTIDLTQNVAQEAIDQNCNFIMAYHPFIFKGLKSITQNDPQQRSLLKLISHNIAVYCPHTAVDSQVGGVNDFLVETLGGEIKSRRPIEASSATEATADCGMGRIVEFAKPLKLGDIINNVKKGLKLDHVQVGFARNQDQYQEISSVALCAGSGGSVLSKVKADLYYTGELSHHEALYLTENGSAVLVCNHSNTERAFLAEFKKQLEKELGKEAEIIVSQTDRDPLRTF